MLLRVVLVITIVLINIYGKQLPAYSKDREICKFYPELVKKYEKELEQLTQEQILILNEVYRAGKEFDMALTATAISWEESKFGLYGLNPITGDYGVMGINLKWYMLENKIPRNYYKEIEIATRLVRDDSFNIAYALKKLVALHKQHKGNWIKIWAWYNGASNYAYAARILNRIFALRKHLDRLIVKTYR